MSNTFTERITGRFGSRTWAVALGIGAAVLAAVLLFVYVDRYRESVAGENAPTRVLVAKKLILAGTSGTIIGGEELYELATVPKKELKLGAISDPAYISGRLAAADILPQQQFTTADFSPETTQAVDTKIKGEERAISISVDSVHGSLSQLAAGDRIDLYTGLGAAGGQALVKLFRANVLVLSVPVNGAGNLILQVKTQDAADFAYAADNTRFYFVLRPAAGAKPTKPDTATINSVLR